MAKDRLKRIFIVLLIAILVVFGVKVFADWQAKKRVAGESISLPTEEVGEKIKDIGEEVLGTAVRVLPGGTTLKEKLNILEKDGRETDQDEVKKETKTETVRQIEIHTQEIIEVIKELPAEQVEKIKKQIFKDFCQEILKE